VGGSRRRKDETVEEGRQRKTDTSPGEGSGSPPLLPLLHAVREEGRRDGTGSSHEEELRHRHHQRKGENEGDEGTWRRRGACGRREQHEGGGREGEGMRRDEEEGSQREGREGVWCVRERAGSQRRSGCCFERRRKRQSGELGRERRERRLRRLHHRYHQ
jgi:hypothetical protein